MAGLGLLDPHWQQRLSDPHILGRGFEVPSEQPEVETPKQKTAHDMFGHLIGLQVAITELLYELAVDTIEENPRTVLMALKGLEAQAIELVGIAKGEIEIGK